MKADLSQFNEQYLIWKGRTPFVQIKTQETLDRIKATGLSQDRLGEQIGIKDHGWVAKTVKFGIFPAKNYFQLCSLLGCRRRTLLIDKDCVKSTARTEDIAPNSPDDSMVDDDELKKIEGEDHEQFADKGTGIPIFDAIDREDTMKPWNLNGPVTLNIDGVHRKGDKVFLSFVDSNQPARISSLNVAVLDFLWGDPVNWIGRDVTLERSHYYTNQGEWKDCFKVYPSEQYVPLDAVLSSINEEVEYAIQTAVRTAVWNALQKVTKGENK